MRFYTILYVLVGILSGVSFLSFGSSVKTDERLWYANRILVTIFDDTETVENLYEKRNLDQQSSNLYASGTKEINEYNKKIQGRIWTSRETEELNRESEKLTKNFELVHKKIEEINKKTASLGVAMGDLFSCLLKQKNVPILISQEILAGVVAASKKLFNDKVAKEDLVADLFKDWYCFEVIEGVYLLIPQQDRIVQGWKPTKTLQQKAQVTPAELRIGFRLDHLQLLDKNKLFEKLKGKEISKNQPAKTYELSKAFSERQTRALIGDKGRSPLFVTRFDRKNVSEELYPEQSWVVIMEGHGSTYVRKDQSTIDYENTQIKTANEAIKAEEKFILEFEKNIDDFKNQKQQNEKKRNESSNFDEVLASLNNAIKITEENISASKSSIDFYNKQIKQMEEQRDQSQAQAGFISGITAEYMSQILDFFDTSIRVRFVFWDSCFSGGANAALVLQQTKQGIQKKFKFDLATGSSTEMFSFGGCSNVDYEAFLRDIFQPSTVQEPVNMMQALQHIHNFYDINDKQKLSLSNIPLYKPAGAEWVQGSSVKPVEKEKKIRSEEQVASFGRILAETCDSKKELNIKTFFGGKESISGPAVLLLFAKDIKCPLLCEEKLPVFESEITGPAVHIFESIRAPKASVTEAAKSFLPFEWLQENKFFWVKKLELSKKVYEAFFLNEAGNVSSKRQALFIEKTGNNVVAVSEVLFSGKAVTMVTVPLKDWQFTKKFYEDKKNKIQIEKKKNSEEQVASFGRILAETCDPKKELNVKTFFGGKESISGPAVLLLFAKDIKCPLLCEEKLPTFISEITGPAVHVFESIRAPKSSDIDAVKSFLSFDSLFEYKFFWVKRLELSGGKVYEAFFLNATDTASSQRRALFIEMKNGKIVSMAEMRFEGKEIVTFPLVKDRVNAKNFYEDQRNKIQNMEAIAQLGLPHEEIVPEKIQKIQATFVTPTPSKVVESQALYQKMYTEQLFNDFARALSRIA